MIDQAVVESSFSAQALAAVERPEGYRSPEVLDPITARSMSLTALDVPLGLAERILWAHSDAKVAEGADALGWEATLADLASDLAVRCAELEARLEQRA